MPKLNGISKISSHIIADENSQFIRCKAKKVLYFIILVTDNFVGSFQKNISHIEALEKAKPYPLFQKLPPANKKKKAAIAA